MFTGIIVDVGEVESVNLHDGGMLIKIITSKINTLQVDMGASIACSGVCLTVIDKGQYGDKFWFTADVSLESLHKTTLYGWKKGTVVNLERPLTMGTELGGHVVLGHVDGIAKILKITKDGDSHRYWIEAPRDLAAFIAPKGSATLNGVSLTVNHVDGLCFDVNIIPHTFANTNFHAVQEGDFINLEIDVLARYVARMNEFREWSKTA